jgi:hypothetical protein
MVQKMVALSRTVILAGVSLVAVGVIVANINGYNLSGKQN